MLKRDSHKEKLKKIWKLIYYYKDTSMRENQRTMDKEKENKLDLMSMVIMLHTTKTMKIKSEITKDCQSSFIF